MPGSLPDKANAALNRIEMAQDTVENICELLTPASFVDCFRQRNEPGDRKRHGFHRGNALMRDATRQKATPLRNR